MEKDMEYTPDVVSVVDEEGKEHLFEELDRIETETGKYIALLPLQENPAEEDDEEFIILKVEENEGEDEVTLMPIEDDKEYEEIGNIFLDRFEEFFAEDGEE